MIKLIMGEKGTGKTKSLIEQVNNTAATVSGNVVCIESAAMMTYDIKPQVRLLNAKENGIDSYEVFRGFVSGLYAGNYDISHIFVDNLCKICGDFDGADEFLTWLDNFTSPLNIKAPITISGSADSATDVMRKYM